MDTKLNEALEFISKLDLAVPDSATKDLLLPLAEPKDKDKGGYVDCGATVSFVAGVSGQNQSDVLNSTLLAQLAADKKYDRWSDPEGWFKFYVQVLGKVGWVIQNFNFTEYTTSGLTFTIDKVVVEILKSIVAEDELAIINETLDALKALSDDKKFVLFESRSRKLEKGNFQVSTVKETDNLVAMKIGAFHFSSAQSATKFLWFGYKSSSTNLFKGAQTITLNGDIYSQVRDTVIQKLGNNAKIFIADLDI